MNKINFTVTSLQNSEVKTQLKNALSKYDGISMVNIDLGRNSVEVGYDETIDKNTIKHCIEKVGCKVQ